MCHSRNINSKINKLHERARKLYKDIQSSCEELLSVDKAVSIPHQNLRMSAIEIYKVEHRLAPDIMNGIFEQMIWS